MIALLGEDRFLERKVRVIDDALDLGNRMRRFIQGSI